MDATLRCQHARTAHWLVATAPRHMTACGEEAKANLLMDPSN